MISANRKTNKIQLSRSTLIIAAIVVVFIWWMATFSAVPFIILAGIIFYRFRAQLMPFFTNIIKTNMGTANENGTTDAKRATIIRRGGGFRKVVLTIIAILFIIWFFSSFVVVIDAGTTGVYSLFGRVKDQEMSAGIHVKNPFAAVHRMSIRTEEYTMSKVASEGTVQGDDSINALTREGLDVNLDITTLYHLEEQRASDVYREVGANYVEKVIRPEIRAVIREAIAQYEAKDVYSEKRQEATQRIFANLQAKLAPRGIILEDVLLRNVTLPAGLAQSIQQKLSAEQEAQKYDFILDKERKEADRKRIEAEGQKDAQQIINEGLSANYLNYLYIKELKDRPGTIYVPTNPANGMPLFREIAQ